MRDLHARPCPALCLVAQYPDRNEFDKCTLPVGHFGPHHGVRAGTWRTPEPLGPPNPAGVKLPEDAL